MKINNKKGFASMQVVMLIVSFMAAVYLIAQADVVSASNGEKDTWAVQPGGKPELVCWDCLQSGHSYQKITNDGITVNGATYKTIFSNSEVLKINSDGSRFDYKLDGTESVVDMGSNSGALNQPPATCTNGQCGGNPSAAPNLANPAAGVADSAGLDNSGTGAPLTDTAKSVAPSIAGKFLGLQGGSVFDGLASGVMWAAAAYGVGYLFGSLLGLDSGNTQALSLALAGATFTYQFLSTFSGTAGLGAWALPIGLGVGAIIFILLYKNIETKTIRFDCMTWQPPSGGNNCEKCNSDTLPCSEYRCKSLGQNCEIVNAGTTQEKCVNINPHDVDQPIITPNPLELTAGHEYTDVKNSPPGPGFRIIRTGSSDGCLKAFTPLKFGITTNEPAQCKIDFNSTTRFDDMRAYMGGSNLYAYNHTETFALPGAKAFQNSSFKLENGKDLVFYLRCKDKNGNVNEAEYGVKFCMDKTPDTTPPKIKATSILNGGCVAENSSFAKVEFYTDEPSECRWGHTDQTYDQMPNNMSCSMNLYQLNAEHLFTCAGNMTGIARDGTDFYVRCKDQPGMNEVDRNKNMESFKFTLRGSTALKLKNLRPNSTIFGGVSPAPVELYTETLFGCDAGKAVCYYSTTGNSGDYIRFFDTENVDGISTQRQDLPAGNYTYYVKCVDSGGNVVNTTTKFNVDIDTSAPVVARIYEESNMLKVVTIRDSECAYTYDNCDFTFNEGNAMPYANSTTHVAEWNKDKTYYIKCRDEFLNEPAECSAIVRPSQNFF